MVMKEHTRGSMPTGPSDAYLRLIRGEISPKKYAAKVKKTVDRQIGKQGQASRIKRAGA